LPNHLRLRPHRHRIRRVRIERVIGFDVRFAIGRFVVDIDGRVTVETTEPDSGDVWSSVGVQTSSTSAGESAGASTTTAAPETLASDGTPLHSTGDNEADVVAAPPTEELPDTLGVSEPAAAETPDPPSAVESSVSSPQVKHDSRSPPGSGNQRRGRCRQ
jgi:hypothetical protein